VEEGGAMMETVTGITGKPVDVVVDPVERQARGLPEKIDSSEYHFGTEAAYLSEADSRLYDATHALIKEAVELVSKAEKAEERSYKLRRDAGLKLVELHRIVREAGKAWDSWFREHVHGVSRATAYRYMAMASEPDLDPTEVQPDGAARQPGEPVAARSVSRETVKETLKKSPRKRLAAIVAKLSESEAEEVLAMVEKWRAKR
jgi:hypothetical protein